MKAIFTGTLNAGFSLTCVLPDDQTEELVATTMTAEAVDVQPPSRLAPAYADPADGNFYLAFIQGLHAGINVYGPFPDEEEAEEFGEFFRREDEAWELFEVQG